MNSIKIFMLLLVATIITTCTILVAESYEDKKSASNSENMITYLFSTTFKSGVHDSFNYDTDRLTVKIEDKSPEMRFENSNPEYKFYVREMGIKTTKKCN